VNGGVATVQSFAEKPWHHLGISEVSDALQTDFATGLSTAEAHIRLQQFGPNEMTAQQRRGPWMRFLLQFHQPLIYILLASTVIAGLIGEWVDASVIFAVAFINAIIGYFQEAKAQQALDALSKMIVTEATVRRGGGTLLLIGVVILVLPGRRLFSFPWVWQFWPRPWQTRNSRVFANYEQPERHCQVMVRA
jgi:cation-transporting P-type ATPase F